MFVVVRAAGSASEQDLAFGVLVALLDDVLSTDASVAALDPYDVADLASVLPGLRSRVQVPNSTGPIDMLLVCRAVRRALAALSTAGRSLCVDRCWRASDGRRLRYRCRGGGSDGRRTY